MTPRDLIGPKIPVLLNPGAGSASEERVAQVLDLFGAAGIHADIEAVDPETAVKRLRELVEAGAPAVAVGGGDGTISSAADELAGSSTILVPLALGTLNHFANRYGLGKLEALHTALSEGSVTSIPVGEVNGHIFLNNASVGFYPHMVRHRDRMKRQLTKWPAAFLASLMVLFKRPLLELDLQLAGARISRTTTAMWIGIGRDSLRLPIPGDADKDGAVLELVIPRPRSRALLVWVAMRVWWKLRGHQKPMDSELEIFRTKDFSIASKRPIDVATDGEVQRIDGPIHFAYRGDAIRVLCMVAPEPNGSGPGD